MPRHRQAQHRPKQTKTAAISAALCWLTALLTIASHCRPALAIPNFLPPPHIEATLPPDWRRGLVASGPIFSPELESRKKHQNGPTALEACLITSGIEATTASLNSTEVFWDTAQSDNLHFHYHPHAIVFPRSTEQVSQALKCANSHGPSVAVSARSGGHSFAGYGSGGQDDSLVIDLKYLDYVHTKTGANRAQVGPATRLGDVVKELWKQGKRGMPHGTCPIVGVGGHALCGGFGPTSRKWGMATDALVEAEVVLANGTVAKANRDTNPELFWALKGAGHNFGIVTDFVFETQPVDGPMLFTEYRWSPSLGSGKDMAKVLDAVQRFATTGSDLPEEYGFHVQIQTANANDPPGGVVAMHMRGIYLGSNANFQSEVAPKLWSHFKSLGAPLPDNKVEREMSYYAIMEEWDDFGKPGDKLDTLAERLLRNNFLARTQLTMGQKGFSRATLAKTLQPLYDRARTKHGKNSFGWNVYLEMYGGGATAKHRSREIVEQTSFPHRDALWLIQGSVATWGRRSFTEDAFAMLDEVENLFVQAMKTDGLERKSFPCYVDAHLDSEEVNGLYYDDKTLSRLQALKKQLDPHNILRNPQGIAGKEYLGPVAASSKGKGNGEHISHPLPRRDTMQEGGQLRRV